jgi:long-chain acyl-CoA synthetase
MAMNIVDRIAMRASAERPALMADGVVLGYGELLDRVSQVAGVLRGLPAFRRGGVPRIGLACHSGVDYIVLALAILKTGACLVPVADELTADERAELLERTGPHAVLLGRGIAWRRHEAAEITSLDGVAWLDLGEPDFAREAEFTALDPAFIRFSSGTTGRSKGVILSHRRLEERVVSANAALGICPGDRVLWMLPMAHHFAVSIILYLYHGACTVIGEDHLATQVLDLAKRSGATVIYGSPFHYALLAADNGDYRWPQLRLAVSTAAPLPAATAAAFASRFGKPLVQGLGIIEIGLPLLNTGGAEEEPTAVGRPLPAYDVELRDEEGVPVSAGRVGELWVKGPGMFDAYLSPWQTAAEVCVAGWFPTGDLAETDAAGRVFIRGRKKSVINVSGMKVFPEEVEAVIERHPEVERCRVFGVRHAVLGSVPAVEVIPAAGSHPDPRALVAWCRGRLSPYKIPARVSLVPSLPLTASGKIRRDEAAGATKSPEKRD